MKRLNTLARSTVGRVLAAVIGLSVVAIVVERSGPATVWAALIRAPFLFPLIVALEAVVVGAEAWCVFVLYGKTERAKVPTKEIFRSSIFSYSLMAVLPFGRAAGEAARAAMLARFVGFPRAAATATHIQGITLLGNAIISVPCAIAVYLLVGFTWLFWATVGNFFLTAILGGGILLVARHTKLGTRIARFFPGGGAWGSAVDDHLQSNFPLGPPLAIVTVSRLALTAQRAVLLAAVGGVYGLIHALTSTSIYMASGVVGDAIPGQVGITEAGYAVTSKLLSLSVGDAVAMALLTHLAQLVWVALGFLSPLLSPAAGVVAAPPPGAPSELMPPQ